MKVLISLVLLYLCSTTCAVDRDVDNTCTTPTHNTGNCIPVKECSLITDLLKNKPITDDTKAMLRSYHCSSDGSNYEVCCPYKNVHLTTKCGRTIHSTADLGAEPKKGDYAWNVLISYATENGPQFLCGGSLINRNYVLTSAHCIKDLPEQYPLLNVRLGEHDVSNNEDFAVDIEVSEVIPYPRYDPVSLDNNVGLLRLSRPANLSVEYVWPICLPHSVVSSSYTTPGKDLYVGSWGSDFYAPKKNELQFRKYEIISNEECQKVYTDVAPQIKIGDNQLCVRPKNKEDDCVSERGDPFYLSNHDVQLGVMSFGSKLCEDNNLPKVVTKITPYMYWILDNLKL